DGIRDFHVTGVQTCALPISTSKIGGEGDNANLPADFEVRNGETAIIAEVYFDFAPFLSELIVEPRVVYHTAHFRPRLGTLEEIRSEERRVGKEGETWVTPYR